MEVLTLTQDEIINVIQKANPQLKDYEFTSNTDLITDVGLSSLQLLITISEIEEKYGIVISPEKIQNKYTIESIINAIINKT